MQSKKEKVIKNDYRISKDDYSENSYIYEILSEMHNNNMTRFSELTEAYKSRIIAIAKSFSLPQSYLDDLVQEGYMSLYNAAIAYNPKYSSFSTFCFLCVRNRMINWIRKNYNPTVNNISISELDDSVLLQCSHADNVEDKIILQSQLEEICVASDKYLSKLERDVFNFFIKGYTADEICGQLNMTKKNYENALFRIRKKLKSALFR